MARTRFSKPAGSIFTTSFPVASFFAGSAGVAAGMAAFSSSLCGRNSAGPSAESRPT
jgi:hypothetical protein